MFAYVLFVSSEEMKCDLCPVNTKTTNKEKMNFYVKDVPPKKGLEK